MFFDLRFSDERFLLKMTDRTMRVSNRLASVGVDSINGARTVRFALEDWFSR